MLIPNEKIREAKEKLGRRNADLMQEFLQMDKYDDRRGVGCCPNPAHDDKTPSCSYNPQTYTYHCFGCGQSWDYITAHMQARNSSFIDACKDLFEAADIQYDFTEHGIKNRRQYYYPEPRYAPNKEIVYAYWEKRKISRATIDYLDIQQNYDGKTLFQYYDLNDTLVSVKARLSRAVKHGETDQYGNKVVKIKYLSDESGKPFDHIDILYNINKINPSEPLIITSGEGDCATCIEAGFKNAVSINGGDSNTNWIGECWDWLQQFDEIILVHDNDPSGEKFAKEVSKRLGEYRVKIAEIPKFRTNPETGEIIEGSSINDLNELLYYNGKDAVRDVLQNAKDIEIPSVVDYTDVKKFDMSDVDGFTTGFGELDNAIVKFYMGSTTLITGAPGSGKTSFLSSIICQSVDQGYPCFVYSGELSNPSLKSWVDFCFAGRFGLNEYDKPGGVGKYYKVQADVFNKINEHYKQQIYLYRDSIDQKVESLMSTAESVVRKLGVKTLIFDNMTSVDLSASDDNKWQKQEEFIRDIVAFSKRWDVCCIVVLHPRKMDSNRRMSLYDLSGVSASINLAHRVMSLYRVSPKEKKGEKSKGTGKYFRNPIDYDVIVDVLKDRFGSGTGKVIGLFYDVPSKRFYDCSATLRHDYRWDTADHSTQELPFGLPTPERIRLEEDREIFGLPEN